MATSEESDKLRAFLKKLKMEKFMGDLQDAGVHCMADLKMLESEEEVQELVGSDGLNLGVVFRRKFTKAVLKLDRSGAPAPVVEAAPVKVAKKKEATPSPSPEPSSPEAEETSSGASKAPSSAEKKSVDKLNASIKDHTVELRLAKEEIGSVKEQVSEVRTQLDEIYKKALGIMKIRRKQLDDALAMAEKETTAKLSSRVTELQTSAKKLLICKQKMEKSLKSEDGGKERSTKVVTSVKAVLDEVPAKETGRIRIIFDTGDDNLLELLETFGTIGVGRTAA